MDRAVTIEEAMGVGMGLMQAGRFAEAEGVYRQVLAAEPGNGDCWCNLGGALLALRRYEEAREALRRAVEARPDLGSAFVNLGAACRELRKFDEAVEAYGRAIGLDGRDSQAHHALGGVLFETGAVAEAIGCLDRALAIDGALMEVAGARLFMMGGVPGVDGKRMLTEARGWSGRFAGGLAGRKEFANERRVGKRLRVGYVSGDFREHPVGRFMLPLLANHDGEAVEVFCYSNGWGVDEVTERMKGMVAGWRKIAGVSDEEVAAMIRGDGIDVLVDLSMHTSGNRMLVFARRPAPVQICYLAYCGTTGVEGMGWRLSDRWLDPVGSDETVYSERTLRLPGCYWCYEPHEKAGAVSELPAAKTGRVTFGSLNNFFKVNEGVLAAWGEILRRVEGSRLILHSMEGSHRERVRKVLGERVEFVVKVGLEEYFASYGRMDVGLDTFPYAGGTTTFGALWMGVPVVTLAGKTGVGRSGVSILSSVGLGELVGGTVEEYVEIAVGLAGDVGRLAGLRGGMREKMRGAGVMDGRNFARGVEGVYREAWGEWCGGVSFLPPRHQGTKRL